MSELGPVLMSRSRVVDDRTVAQIVNNQMVGCPKLGAEMREGLCWLEVKSCSGCRVNRYRVGS